MDQRPSERRAATRTAVVWDAVAGVLGPGVAPGVGGADEEPRHVVDIGGGTGGFAVRVARLGHRVTVVDPSPDALASLARRARESDVADLVTGVQGDLAGLPALVEEGLVDRGQGAGVDLVLCHGVLGLLDDPADGLVRIRQLLRPGGALSLLVSQRHAAVLARAMAGHFRAAQEMVQESEAPATDPVGVQQGMEHRFTAQELSGLLADSGYDLAAMQAVRVFTDLVPGSLLDLEPGAGTALLELERAVAERPEYLTLAAQLHALATV